MPMSAADRKSKKIEADGYIVTDGYTLLGVGETPEAAVLDALTSGGTRPLEPDVERWSTVDGVHCTLEEAGEV